jgi:glutathione synthase/RimK-type ligase-like ATP-grasp enzyme
MNLRVIGVYREPEFSPGKIDADAAIVDSALAGLRDEGADTRAVDAAQFAETQQNDAHLILAMCQGAAALSRLAEVEEAGALTVNSALAIRNCYRDLLAAGLMRAGLSIPDGVLMNTGVPVDRRPLRALNLSSPMYVKRGNLHALGPDDVRRVEGVDQVERALLDFASRGVELAYVQQEAPGGIVKFYGVGNDYFCAIPQDGSSLKEPVRRALAHAARTAARALGLEVWGGDAAVEGESCNIIDFNDWPSFAPVRAEAAAAIARHCMHLLRRNAVSQPDRSFS